MKRIHVIYILSAVLVVLIILKFTTGSNNGSVTRPGLSGYPIQLSDSEFTTILCSVDDFGDKVEKAVRERTNNSCDAPLFFCGDSVALGLAQASFNSLAVPTTEVHLGQEVVSAKVLFEFNTKGELSTVRAKISPDESSRAFNYFVTYYGPKHLSILDRAGVNNKCIWFFPSCYVYLYWSGSSDTFITVSDLNSLPYSNYERIVRDGGNFDYMFGDAPSQIDDSSRPYTSPTKTYKYGDSDVYQGSSKQKEDLEAIDKYFGF